MHATQVKLLNLRGLKRSENVNRDCRRCFDLLQILPDGRRRTANVTRR